MFDCSVLFQINQPKVFVNRFILAIKQNILRNNQRNRTISWGCFMAFAWLLFVTRFILTIKQKNLSKQPKKYNYFMGLLYGICLVIIMTDMIVHVK